MRSDRTAACTRVRPRTILVRIREPRAEPSMWSNRRPSLDDGKRIWEPANSCRRATPPHSDAPVWRDIAKPLSRRHCHTSPRRRALHKTPLPLVPANIAQATDSARNSSELQGLPASQHVVVNQAAHDRAGRPKSPCQCFSFSSRMYSAARRTALTISTCVPQRQRLKRSASQIALSSG